MSRLARTLRMIKVEHSVFALPFALAGAWLAAGGLPPLLDLALVVLAAVLARSAAMAFNRWADRDVDATNPRTAVRELPSGQLSAGYALGFTVVCAAGFVAAAWALAPICGWLALPTLVVLLGYSRLKRFTWLCHLGLGLALGIAPVGAWLAVAKDFAPEVWAPVWIGVGVLAWTAGFDLLYAIQDIEHDRAEGLSSFAARFGAGAARAASGLCFLLALGAWWAAGERAGLGAAYLGGLGGVAALLALMHWLVRGGRHAAVPVAFFRVNAWVGPLYFAALWLALPEAPGDATLGS